MRRSFFFGVGGEETGASTVSLQAFLPWHSALCLGRCPRLPSANPASLKPTPTLASANLSLHRYNTNICFSALCVVLYSLVPFFLSRSRFFFFYFLLCSCPFSCLVLLFPVLLSCDLFSCRLVFYGLQLTNIDVH